MLLTNPPFLASITENRWANDTDGFVLTAQPGRSQGRPPNCRARSPSRKKRPAQPAFPRKPLSRSAETRSQPGQQPSERQFHGPNCASEHGDRGGACSSPDALAVVASSEAPPFHPKQRPQSFGKRSRMWRRSVEDFQIEPVEVLGVGDDVHLDDPSVSDREARDRNGSAPGWSQRTAHAAGRVPPGNRDARVAAETEGGQQPVVVARPRPNLAVIERPAAARPRGLGTISALH